MVPDKLVSANSRLSVDNSLDLKDNYFDPDLMHRGSVLKFENGGSILKMNGLIGIT